ncbi:MAG: hypothetical protein AAGF86_05715 [Pseudomonadota bacterium]
MKVHYSVSLPGSGTEQRYPSTHYLQAIVYLSLMWIIIFGFAAASWTLFGGMVATQLAVVSGLIVTVAAFINSDMRNHEALHRELARKTTKR